MPQTQPKFVPHATSVPVPPGDSELVRRAQEELGLDESALFYLRSLNITFDEPLDCATAGIDFDTVGIRNAVLAHRGKPLPIVGEQLHHALDRHTRGAPLADDRTLVLVRRT